MSAHWNEPRSPEQARARAEARAKVNAARWHAERAANARWLADAEQERDRPKAGDLGRFVGDGTATLDELLEPAREQYRRRMAGAAQ